MTPTQKLIRDQTKLLQAYRSNPKLLKKALEAFMAYGDACSSPHEDLGLWSKYHKAKGELQAMEAEVLK